MELRKFLFVKCVWIITIICTPWVLFSICISEANSQEKREATKLSEVVVSDSYSSEQDHPFSFTELEATILEPQLQGQEPSFVLARAPSLNVYSDSGAYQGYSYLRLRGIDQSRLNVTLDGVPLSEPEDQGVYFSNYPDLLNSIERVQIVRGVGLSQNGTASYGGSLNFDSHQFSEGEQKQIGIGGGSFGTGRAFVEYESGRREKDLVIYLRAANLHSDGYRRRSGNDSRSLFYKIANTDANDRWELGGFLGHQENKLAWLGATEDERERDIRFNANTNEEDQFLQSLTYARNIKRLDNGDVLTTSVYYNHLQGNYDFDLNNFLGMPPNEQLFNYDFDSHFLGAYSNYKVELESAKITAGVHGNIYEREHVGSEANTGELYRNKGKKNEASVFARVENRWEKLLFLADMQGRYTEFSYIGSTDVPSMHWAFFNPKAGVTWDIHPAAQIYYSVGRTGREPTRNDIFVGNDDLALGEDGKPLLGPRSAEFVVDHEFGIRTYQDNWTLKANTFYMDFDQEIVLNGKVGPNGLPLTSSVDRSYRTGIEVEYETKIQGPLKGFTLFGNSTWLQSKITQGAASFTPVISPRWIVNQGGSYSWNAITLRTDFRYQAGSWIDFANNTKLDSFMTTNLAAEYTMPSWLVSLQFNNIFAERYSTNGYSDVNGDARYFAQAPRAFFATVTWKL